MESLTGPLVMLLGATLVIYVLLRIFALTPLTDRSGVETARIHAFWTGLIAWMSIGSTRLTEAGVWQTGEAQGNGFAAVVDPLVIFLVPAIAVPLLHILGQFTWPKHQRSIRHADLAVRTIGRFLPRSLAATVVTLFVLSVVFALAVSSVDALAPVPADPTADNGYATTGRIAGSTFSLALLMSLIALAMGVVVSLLVITRRRPVETLSSANDAILRIISMNRLLRTAGALTIMLMATALGYVAFPTPAWGNWFDVAHPVAMVLSLVGLGILALWKPPSMVTGTPELRKGQLSASRTGSETAAGRATAVTAAAIGFLASFAVVNLIPVDGGHAHLRDHLFPVQFAVPAVVFLVTIFVYERQRRAPDSHEPDSCREVSHRPKKAIPPVPLVALVIAAVGAVALGGTLIAVLAVSDAATSLLEANSAARVPTAYDAPLDAPFPDGMFLLPTVIATAILASVAALTLIRVRRADGKGSHGSAPSSDETQALTHRILCAVGASCLAMAAAVLWGTGQRWMISAGYAPGSSVQEYTELVLTLMNLAMPTWFVAAIAAFTPAPVSAASENPAPAHSSP